MTRSPDLISGAFTGRYTVDRELGRGATSIVYLAHDSGDGRAVAIKVLRHELITEINTWRFLREIRVTTDLRHPNIVPVLDSGEFEGRPYFVLPHMAGGTLRARLQSEKQLQISEVITLGTTMARALQFAHDRKLLHRDVKPENILFDADGRACLADFGIARALSEASGESTTSTGVVRGTPAYMSPEQAAGERDIDGRSDIYSLGCVLYEALAGVPAFVGPTSQSIVAQRISHLPRSVSMYRPTVPRGLEQVLERALATAPVDRYQSAAEFGEMLESASVDRGSVSGGLVKPKRSSRRAIWVTAAVGTIAVLLALSLSKGRLRFGLDAFGALDSLTYAVVSFDSARSPAHVDVAGLLRESLRRWTDIKVADPDHISSAGRYIQLKVAPSGDSLRLQATLIDAKSKSVITEATVRLSSKLERGDSVMAAFAERLLFPEVGSQDAREAGGGSSSFFARRAYLRGHVAMMRWNLARADSEFRRATEADARYSAALLRLAQVRQWSGQPVALWGFASERAEVGKASLNSDDRLMAEALASLARGRRDVACARWLDLTKRDRSSFAAWYGLGNCLRYDSVVVRDVSNPSAWRFRSSYQQAVNAYDRAFALLPAAAGFIGVGLLDDVARLLKVSGPALRTGRANSPDTTNFLAWPAWDADSLVFLPFPVSRFDAVDATTSRSAAVDQAILHERYRFAQVARRWRSQLPNSAEAAEGVARALDLLGNASAFDTLRVARRLATDDIDRLRLGTLEVFMRVKYSVPSGLEQLRASRALADSLLRANQATDPAGMSLVAALAALTGRANLGARYAHSAEAFALSPALDRSAPALLAFAALGGPTDSLRILESEVWRAIASSVLPADRARAIENWVARPAFLAIPNYRFATSSRFGKDRRFENLLEAWEHQDLARARKVLTDLKTQRLRGGVRAWDVTIDAVYAEAAVLASLSDASGAVAWLDPVLDSLSFVSPQQLADVARAGTLVRAMALRADLAHALSDSLTAKKWARAVMSLWTDPDAFLMPTVTRMRGYVK